MCRAKLDKMRAMSIFKSTIPIMMGKIAQDARDGWPSSRPSHDILPWHNNLHVNVCGPSLSTSFFSLPPDPYEITRWARRAASGPDPTTENFSSKLINFKPE